jgi:hypothetical protein
LVKKMKDLSSGELYKGLSGAPFFFELGAEAREAAAAQQGR